MRHLNDEIHSSIFYVEPYEDFAIEIVENQLTGYRWRVDYDNRLLNLSGFDSESYSLGTRGVSLCPQILKYTFSPIGEFDTIIKFISTKIDGKDVDFACGPDEEISIEYRIVSTLHKNKHEAEQKELIESNSGLFFERYFTGAGDTVDDVYTAVKWNFVDVSILNSDGTPTFEQKGVEIPEFYSETAAKIIASKYFRGHVGQEGREYSLKQLINRVVNTIVAWGQGKGKDGTVYFTKEYDAETFRAELTYVLLHQYAAFNSPVWFNLGVNGLEASQSSACFINSLEDSMDSILDLFKTEGKIFSGGSGSGINLSKLRARGEKIKSTGTSSGPLSFMKGFDRSAGAIKSGGTCLAPYQMIYTELGPRRVDELSKLNEFIVLSYDPPAGRYKAKKAKAWKSGNKLVCRVTTDKGCFDLTTDHPVKMSTLDYVEAGNLNPGMSLFQCSVDDRNGYIRIHLRNGKKGKMHFHRMIMSDVLEADIKGLSVHHIDGNRQNNSVENLNIMHQSQHAALHSLDSINGGTHIFVKNKYPKAGVANGMHRSGKFYSDSEKVSKYAEKQPEILKESGRPSGMQKLSCDQRMINTAFKILNGGGSIDTIEDYIKNRNSIIGRVPNRKAVVDSINNRFGNYDNFVEAVRSSNHRVKSVEMIGYMDVYDVEVECGTIDDHTERSGHNFVIWPNDNPVGSGIAVSNTRRAACMRLMDIDHPDVQEFIHCKEIEEKKAHALIDAGYSGAFNADGGAYDTVAFQNANHSIRVTDDFMNAVMIDGDWNTTYRTNGKVASTLRAKKLLMEAAEACWFSGDPGIQYDTIINKWHTCKATDKIYASNPCCFTGDTLVETNQGRFSIADMAASKGLPCKRKDVSITSFDLKSGSYRCMPMIKAWQSGHTKSLVEVRTHNGLLLKCTPDHKFLTYGGEYISASVLREGEKLRTTKSDDVQWDTVASVTAITLEEAVPVYDIDAGKYRNFAVVSGGYQQVPVIVSNSEYLFLNDSACNLASLNLMKFVLPNGEFNVQSFCTAVEIMITAMEILVGNSSYPTKKIEENSHRFRPLGLGYANLGALLMSNGIPYDSESGRNYAAAITSLMSSTAYAMSGLIAHTVRPFDGYEENRSSFIEVMDMHKAADGLIKKTPENAKLLDQSYRYWNDVILYSIGRGIRNSQISVLAPVGTISFMMDCDTTGIEPDIALVKYKSLVGGGYMKLTNQSVEKALNKLGYSQEDTATIIAYISENDTIEGCNTLKSEHLPVFDCAFKAANGTRSIPPKGHIDMMAAVQPFLSGAISKTANVPNEATAQDIFDLFVYAWRQGVKCVAIYRDGCKRSQPLSTKKEDSSKEEIVVEKIVEKIIEIPTPIRRKLPNERPSITHKFNVGGHEGYLITGLFADGSPGELFLRISKEGSTLSGLLDAFATSISLNLQYGVPLETLIAKFEHTKFEPSGYTGNENIKFAKSIIDYIFRWMKFKFIDKPKTDVVESSADIIDVNVTSHEGKVVGTAINIGNEKQSFVNQSDAPFCSNCGEQQVRRGACFYCDNCGTSGGCG